MQTKQNLKNLRASELSFARESSRRSRSVDESLNFQQALADTPDVRTEKVARGKALIADPNYPSKEQLGKIAAILAGHLGKAEISPKHSPAKRRHVTSTTGPH